MFSVDSTELRGAVVTVELTSAGPRENRADVCGI